MTNSRDKGARGKMKDRDCETCAHAQPFGGPTPELKTKVRAEVVRFIRSDWFQLLTTLDPELLIEKLREEQTHV